MSCCVVVCLLKMFMCDLVEDLGGFSRVRHCGAISKMVFDSLCSNYEGCLTVVEDLCLDHSMYVSCCVAVCLLEMLMCDCLMFKYSVLYVMCCCF